MGDPKRGTLPTETRPLLAQAPVSLAGGVQVNSVGDHGLAALSIKTGAGRLKPELPAPHAPQVSETQDKDSCAHADEASTEPAQAACPHRGRAHLGRL